MNKAFIFKLVIGAWGLAIIGIISVFLLGSKESSEEANMGLGVESPTAVKHYIPIGGDRAEAEAFLELDGLQNYHQRLNFGGDKLPPGWEIVVYGRGSSSTAVDFIVFKDGVCHGIGSYDQSMWGGNFDDEISMAKELSNRFGKPEISESFSNYDKTSVGYAGIVFIEHLEFSRPVLMVVLSSEGDRDIAYMFWAPPSDDKSRYYDDPVASLIYQILNGQRNTGALQNLAALR